MPEVTRLPAAADVIAPDGMEVRILGTGRLGSLAHFRLQPNQTGRAIRHRTVEEAWHIVAGTGEVWFSDGETSVTEIASGTSFLIPPGTSFQLRNTGPGPLDAICTTMPPWPGADEAELVRGHWSATI